MIEYVAIDSTLGLNREDVNLLAGILETKELDGKKILLLQFQDMAEMIIEDFFKIISLINNLWKCIL